MFQNLTNYFLGSFVNQDQTAATEGVETNSLRLRTSEDDWVLVERDSEGNSDASSVASLDIDEEVDDFVNTTLPFSMIMSRTSSTSSLPHTTTTMDESWFLTPPPCFTSTGPIHMETSPLENLLIEHPSMSVYTHHMRRLHNVPVRTYIVAAPTTAAAAAAGGGGGGGGAGADDDDDDDNDDDHDGIVEEVEPVVLVRRRRHINRMHILQQQELQNVKGKQEQKARIQKACQSMKRGCLERNNKAREVNSRNRRQSRGERSQGATRSYANNNRKC